LLRPSADRRRRILAVLYLEGPEQRGEIDHVVRGHFNDAVTGFMDEAGNVIETHEHAEHFKEW
jgi:hypothetical protein